MRRATLGVGVLTTACYAVGFAASSGALKAVATLLAVAYAVMLVRWLARVDPADGPGQPDPAATAERVLTMGRGHRLGFAARLTCCVCALVALMIVGLAIGTGTALIGASAIVAVRVAVARRREITRRDLAWGLGSGLACGAIVVGFGSADLGWAVFVLVSTPPLFVAGAVLRRRAGVGAVRVLDRRYGRAAAGLALGALLYLPLALFNLVGIQGRDDWVTHWWQPVAAVQPGVFEETWARLFLLTLLYLILRPGGHRRALVAAVLLSSLAHGFAHSGFNPLGLLVGSLMFFVPVAMLFLRRDLEHAVGGHATTDLLRYGAAYLGNT